MRRGRTTIGGRDGVVTAADPAMAAADALKVGARFGRVVLAPLGTGADDGARITAVYAACAGIYPVVHAPGTWYGKTRIALPSNLHVTMHPGCRWRFSPDPAIPLDGTSCAGFYATFVDTGAGNTTLAARAERGATTISTVASIAIGTIIRVVRANRFIRGYYVVRNIIGSGPYTVTLDRRLVRSYVGGSAVEIVTSIPQNIILDGNGATFECDVQIDRYLELFAAQHCRISGIKTIVGAASPANMHGSFDVGGYDNWWLNMNADCGGVSSGGWAHETQEGGGARDCISQRGIANEFWCNDSDGVLYDNCWGMNGAKGIYFSSANTDGCWDCVVRGGRYEGNSNSDVYVYNGAGRLLLDGLRTRSIAGAKGILLNNPQNSGDVVTIRDCDIEDTATGWGLYVGNYNYARLEGRNSIRGTGTHQFVDTAGEINRGTVTLNGATEVVIPFRDINAQDHVRLTRNTAAGTPGVGTIGLSIPNITVTNPDMSVAASWTEFQCTRTSEDDALGLLGGAKYLKLTYDGTHALGMAYQTILVSPRSHRVRILVRGDGACIPVISDGTNSWAGTASTSPQWIDCKLTGGTLLQLRCNNLDASGAGGHVDFGPIQVDPAGAVVAGTALDTSVYEYSIGG